MSERAHGGVWAGLPILLCVQARMSFVHNFKHVRVLIRCLLDLDGAWGQASAMRTTRTTARAARREARRDQAIRVLCGMDRLLDGGMVR